MNLFLQVESADIKAPKTRTLAAIPKGALTLEEVERNHIQLARRSSLPIPPPPLPSGSFLFYFLKRVVLYSRNSGLFHMSDHRSVKRSSVATARVAIVIA